MRLLFEIGRQQGHSQADRMRHLLTVFGIDLAAPWHEADFLQPLERHLPQLVDEMHGIADGSGLSMREVCALSFLVDIGIAVRNCDQ